ncbi:MAG TPA: glycosyltransferase [Longimicrobium sp.]|jgi:glycosyltransferase involved in cell wall biosynthesis|uniref:glycosyltransferase n=1 Tax=Longimicrobium sp. TaxID=2029185 RepID=UPI002EDB34F5
MFVVAHNGARLFGGAERGVARILEGLQRRGHRVLMICTDHGVAARVQELGVPVRVVPLGGDIALHHAFGLARVLRALRPDVLMIGTFKKVAWAALAGRMARVPRIVLRIGLETDLPRSLKYRISIPRVHTVVLKADDVRPRWRAALPGFAEERLVTIHGAVEPPVRRGPPGAVRAELGLAADTPVIGAVARLARQKRFDRLLRAFATLPPHVHCILAGDGEQRAEVEALAKSLGIHDRLHLLGHRDDVGDVLAALDVFVVTSDKEMLAFAMLEALAAGVPVVSTPVSGAREALEPLPDGTAPGVVTGWEDAEIAAALAALLADSGRRARMAEAAVRRARERFGYERMLDEWEAVLAAKVAA